MDITSLAMDMTTAHRRPEHPSLSACTLSSPAAEAQLPALAADEVLGFLLTALSVVALCWVGGLLCQRRRALSRRAAAVIDASEKYLPECTLYDDALAPRWSLPSLCGALSRDLDEAAPVVSWQKEPVQCVVCLADVEVGEDARSLPCAHAFHAPCANLWLVHSCHNACPTCSATVVPSRDNEMRCR